MQTRHIFSQTNRQADFHLALIKCAEAFGHQGNDKGMCLGFTMAWIEAILTEKTSDFLRMGCQIIRLDNRLKAGFSLASVEDRLLWELKAFYDNIVLYQHSCVSSSVLEKQILQLDVEQVSTIAASDDLQSKGGFKKTKAIHFGRFQKEEIGHFLKALEKKIQASKYEHPIPFLLSLNKAEGGLHAVNISYYPATQSWQFMDVNFFPPKAPESNFETFLSQFTTSVYQFFSISAILPNQENIETLERKMFEVPLIGKNIDANRMLHFAAFQGDDRVVERLLSEGVSPNVPDIYTRSPLIIAAQYGHLAVVELLLRTGADIHEVTAMGVTAFLIAAQNGHLSVMEALLRAGADIHQTVNKGVSALFIAAQNGHLAIVELLLGAGVDVDQASDLGNTPLMTASEKGHLAVVERLLRAGANMSLISSHGATALMIASQYGHLAVVDVLLRAGANLHDDIPMRSYAFIIAAKKGHIRVLELLLRAGVNVNQIATDGVSALFLATKNGHVAVVERLLRAGADILQKNVNGATALMIAAKNGNIQLVELLLQAGANGEKTLVISPQNRHLQKFELLLKAADILHRSLDITNAFLCAVKNGHIEVVEILLEAGANINEITTGVDSPLLMAVKNNNLHMLEILLSQDGIDIQHIVNALLFAVLAGFFDMVKALLKHHGIDEHMKRSCTRESLYDFLAPLAFQDPSIMMRIEAHLSIYPNQEHIPIDFEQIASILGHVQIAEAISARQETTKPLLKRSRIGH